MPAIVVVLFVVVVLQPLEVVVDCFADRLLLAEDAVGSDWISTFIIPTTFFGSTVTHVAGVVVDHGWFLFMVIDKGFVSLDVSTRCSVPLTLGGIDTVR